MYGEWTIGGDPMTSHMQEGLAVAVAKWYRVRQAVASADEARRARRAVERYTLWADVGLLGQCSADTVTLYLHETLDTAKTRRNHLCHLRSFFSWCKDNGLIHTDPTDSVPKLTGASGPGARPFTPGEVARLCEVAAEREADGRAVPGRHRFYLTAALTGLRRGTLRRLTAGMVLIDESPRLVVPSRLMKSGRPHEVHMERAGLLAAVLATQAAGKHPDELLWHPSPDYKTLWADLERAGIDRRTPEGIAGFHSFRKFAATEILAAGGSIKTVQDFLGHATPAMALNVYAKSRQEDTSRAQAGLERLIKTLPAKKPGRDTDRPLRDSLGSANTIGTETKGIQRGSTPPDHPTSDPPMTPRGFEPHGIIGRIGKRSEASDPRGGWESGDRPDLSAVARLLRAAADLIEGRPR